MNSGMGSAIDSDCKIKVTIFVFIKMEHIYRIFFFQKICIKKKKRK